MIVMRNKWAVAIIVIAVVFIFVSNLYSREVILKPKKISVITSPEDSRDSRVIVYFDLPKELSKSNVEIDYAILIFKAQVTDAVSGLIEVFPITKDWKTESAISWESPWDSLGGDYTKDYSGRSVSVKSESGMGKIKSNVTFIVKGWLDGIFVNNGLMIKPSKDDLENFPVKYSIYEDNIKLKISFCLD